MMTPVAPVPSAVDPAEPAPEALVEAGRYRNAQDGFEHGLAVLALGDAYWLLAGEGGFRLLVEPAAADRAREQLARFDRENAGWPPQPVLDGPARPLDLLTPLIWAIVVIAAFREQTLHPPWTDAGLLDRAAMLRGEWWRPFTALFLHGDASHLASNLLGGLLAFAAVASTFGRRRGWLLLALSAVAGNVAVALAHTGEAYRSLGASTAIFAAVGLLTGRAMGLVARHRRAHRWRAFFLPVATGLTVLGLQGAGDSGQVDVMAHVAGFIAGILFGFLPARAAPPAPDAHSSA
jgi:membrane associated rhomboid family serine protease